MDSSYSYVQENLQMPVPNSIWDCGLVTVKSVGPSEFSESTPLPSHPY